MLPAASAYAPIPLLFLALLFPKLPIASVVAVAKPLLRLGLPSMISLFTILVLVRCATLIKSSNFVKLFSVQTRSASLSLYSELL